MTRNVLALKLLITTLATSAATFAIVANFFSVATFAIVANFFSVAKFFGSQTMFSFAFYELIKSFKKSSASCAFVGF